MSQAIQTVTTIPRRRRRAVAPVVMPIEFGWSKQKWVASFFPGPTDIGMVVLLHHDAAELKRVVAGLVAFQESARQALRLRRARRVGRGTWWGNCR
jgi:hypothetical protein